VLLESDSPLDIAEFHETTSNQYHVLKLPDKGLLFYTR
jgi:hypothetical protein